MTLFSKIRAALRTATEVFVSFQAEQMGFFRPAVVVLLLVAAVLYFMTAVSPLAPFVYPLF